MNWYIYWHLAVEEYCKEIYTSANRQSRLVCLLITLPVILLSFFALQLIGEKLNIPFLEDNAPEIGLVLGISDMILFYDESKRHRRWMEKYNQCRTDEKDLACFLLACLSVIAVIALLFIAAFEKN